MITRSHSLKAITSIALVAMACVGLVNCGGGGGGSEPTGSGSGDQIMIQPRPPASVGPDLAVGLPSVSNSAPTVGTQFTLSAIVRNDGDTPSAATTLRYYQSTDATITTSDTAVGTGAVAELAASATSSGSVDLTAPSTAGAYYYGACVDAVTDESDTTNNCSASVQVDVSEPQQGQGGPQTPQGPDLAAVAFFLASGVHDGAPGRSLTFQARIRNVGNVVSPATTLRFYSSRNRTISTDDTLLGTVAVETIIPSRRIDSKTLTLTAPSTPGTYYYGACVDAVTDESDTTNNCSDARPITVDGPPPDLVVTGPNVGEIQADGTFWFIATVGNQGAGGAAATTVRYKRSTDGTITTSDTTVGTDEAPTLIPSAGYGATIQLTAPSTPGTYYYGVCVDPVPSESDTSNNCSASVRVEVGGPPPDLVVLAPSVSAINETPPLDGTFSLVVTVRNQGGGTAAATTVRYYRSTDGTITTSDTQLHTGPVNRLSPFGNLRGNDSADGGGCAWHILLRRVRGRGAQGVRHHQQLLGIGAGHGVGNPAAGAGQSGLDVPSSRSRKRPFGGRDFRSVYDNRTERRGQSLGSFDATLFAVNGRDNYDFRRSSGYGHGAGASRFGVQPIYAGSAAVKPRNVLLWRVRGPGGGRVRHDQQLFGGASGRCTGAVGASRRGNPGPDYRWACHLL